jgi:hypothetical protein
MRFLDAREKAVGGKKLGFRQSGFELFAIDGRDEGFEMTKGEFRLWGFGRAGSVREAMRLACSGHALMCS